MSLEGRRLYSDDTSLDKYRIIRKHYRSESERMRKIKDSAKYFQTIRDAIGQEIGELLHKGINFCILNIEDKTIYVAAWACCGTPEHLVGTILDDQTKRLIENKIVYNTPMNKVIWET